MGETYTDKPKPTQPNPPQQPEPEREQPTRTTNEPSRDPFRTDPDDDRDDQ